MTLCYGFQNVLIIVMYYVRIVRSVVPEYCLQPLNTNDCGLKPTAVMTYWKPGSRCEIEVWRGCPTVNKFEDEYNCSTTCIFQAPKPEVRSQDLEEKDECKAVMNDKKCADFEQEVYTFKDGHCVPTVWRGCPTLNKFINSTVCNNTCAPGKWIYTLEQMNVTDLVTLNGILDSFLDVSLEVSESEQVSGSAENESEEQTQSNSNEVETLDEDEESNHVEHESTDQTSSDSETSATEAGPTEPDPGPEPTDAEPEPDASEAVPTEPEPTEAGPTEPEPTEPEPTEPEPTEPEPTEPEPETTTAAVELDQEGVWSQNTACNPLNTNDCGLKPTAVMTYWKPGSRCEIEVWRGCPTVNKFDDEYNCSTTCIFQAPKPKVRSQEPEEKDECKEIMIDKKCADFEQEVYTFKDGLCVPTVWRGCPTLNKFINSTVCNNTCTQNWLDQLGNLNLASLEIINEILDGIIENSNEIAESSGSEDKSVQQSDSVESENEIVNHVNEKPESNGSSEDGSEKELYSTTVEAEISNGEEINTEPKDEQDEHITNEPTEIKQTIGVARPSVFIDPRYKHNNM